MNITYKIKNNNNHNSQKQNNKRFSHKYQQTTKNRTKTQQSQRYNNKIRSKSINHPYLYYRSCKSSNCDNNFMITRPARIFTKKQSMLQESNLNTPTTTQVEYDMSNFEKLKKEVQMLQHQEECLGDGNKIFHDGQMISNNSMIAESTQFMVNREFVSDNKFTLLQWYRSNIKKNGKKRQIQSYLRSLGWKKRTNESNNKREVTGVFNNTNFNTTCYQSAANRTKQGSLEARKYFKSKIEDKNGNFKSLMKLVCNEQKNRPQSIKKQLQFIRIC